MKLTLGQAAKEVGISKPSISAAIKKGRLSAHKSENGYYEIDPSELFRVYPPKPKTNAVSEPVSFTEANPVSKPSKGAESVVLNILLAEKDKLIEEKEASIKRLEEEKGLLREDLTDQKDQTKRMTLLLENHSTKDTGDEWKSALRDLESKVSNQEKEGRDERQKILRQNKALKDALDAEKSKSFWQKLFG
jgi:hypothetical protein